MHPTSDTNLSQLAAVFNFATTDLAANRLGQLSERQTAMLATQGLVGRAVLILLGLALLAYAFIPTPQAGSFETLQVLFTTGRPPPNLPADAIITWLCMKLPVAGLLGSLSIGITFWEQDNTVRRVAGPIHLKEIKRRNRRQPPALIRTTSYALQVADELFTLTSAQGQALMPNRAYAVYYRKQAWSTFILSLEPLPENTQLGPQ